MKCVSFIASLVIVACAAFASPINVPANSNVYTDAPPPYISCDNLVPGSQDFMSCIYPESVHIPRPITINRFPNAGSEATTEADDSTTASVDTESATALQRSGKSEESCPTLSCDDFTPGEPAYYYCKSYDHVPHNPSCDQLIPSSSAWNYCMFHVDPAEGFPLSTGVSAVETSEEIVTSDYQAFGKRGYVPDDPWPPARFCVQFKPGSDDYNMCRYHSTNPQVIADAQGIPLDSLLITRTEASTEVSDTTTAFVNPELASSEHPALGERDDVEDDSDDDDQDEEDSDDDGQDGFDSNDAKAMSDVIFKAEIADPYMDTLHLVGAAANAVVSNATFDGVAYMEKENLTIIDLLNKTWAPIETQATVPHGIQARGVDGNMTSKQDLRDAVLDTADLVLEAESADALGAPFDGEAYAKQENLTIFNPLTSSALASSASTIEKRQLPAIGPPAWKKIKGRIHEVYEEQKIACKVGLYHKYDRKMCHREAKKDHKFLLHLFHKSRKNHGEGGHDAFKTLSKALFGYDNPIIQKRSKPDSGVLSLSVAKWDAIKTEIDYDHNNAVATCVKLLDHHAHNKCLKQARHDFKHLNHLYHAAKLSEHRPKAAHKINKLLQAVANAEPLKPVLEYPTKRAISLSKREDYHIETTRDEYFATLLERLETLDEICTVFCQKTTTERHARKHCFKQARKQKKTNMHLFKKAYKYKGKKGQKALTTLLDFMSLYGSPEDFDLSI